MFVHKGSLTPAASHTVEECKRDIDRYSKAVGICDVVATPASKEGCILDLGSARPKHAAQLGISRLEAAGRRAYGY